MKIKRMKFLIMQAGVGSSNRRIPLTKAGDVYVISNKC